MTDSILLQQAAHRIARLRADAQPVLDPFAVQTDRKFLSRIQGIKTAKFLDDLAIPGSASIDGGYPISGAMPTTNSLQSNPNRHATLLTGRPALKRPCTYNLQLGKYSDPSVGDKCPRCRFFG